jgi:TolB-like protein/Tfp pilus assembly protein PilF
MTAKQPQQQKDSGRSLFAELRQRKVFRSAAIYGAVAWGVTEVLVTITEQLFLPQWISTLAVIGFVVGFPVAMILSWTFDITGDGIRRTSISSRRGQASIVLSLLLLVAGTSGLFFLIKPSLQERETEFASADIMPNSVAVLPFENASQDPADAYMSEGLSDELRNQLGQVEGLRLAARSSSVSVRERGMAATEASSSLGVALLVEGSLRRQGNRLRISVQLIEGSTGLALWSDSYERGSRELLSVQQAIAEEIVGRVLPDSDPVVSEPATRDADANELMLLAHHYEQQVRDRQEVNMGTLLKAVELYRQAVVADPESALAHSRLAGALLYLGDIDAAEAPIFKALALNPNLSEVQNTLGEFYWARGLPGAATAFERAMRLNPNNADALTNFANWAILSWSFAEPEANQMVNFYRRALELDPLSIARHAALGEFIGYFGLTDQLPPVIEGILELFDSVESLRLVSWLEELSGNTDRAIAWALRARDREADNPDHIERLAELYALIGDFETVEALLPEPGIGILFFMRRYEDLIDAAEFLMIEEPNDVNVRYLLAFAYQAVGQYEAAVHVLRSTGLPDSVLDDMARSVTEIDAFFTLINALAGVGQTETDETARSLAQWSQDGPWWGDESWVGIARGCNLAVLGHSEEALQHLQRITNSAKLAREPLLHDMWCWRSFQHDPTYQAVVRDQDERRAALRERLPATLAEFGVTL